MANRESNRNQRFQIANYNCLKRLKLMVDVPKIIGLTIQTHWNRRMVVGSNMTCYRYFKTTNLNCKLNNSCF